MTLHIPIHPIQASTNPRASKAAPRQHFCNLHIGREHISEPVPRPDSDSRSRVYMSFFFFVTGSSIAGSLSDSHLDLA